MKKTKRLLALALILAMLAALGAPAFAAEAQYSSTKAFLEGIKEIDGFECEVMGLVEDEGFRYEMVKVKYDGEVSNYVTNIQLLFSEDSAEPEAIGEVRLYVYNLVNFGEDKLAEVLDALNEVNASCAGVKFYADKSDCSITAEMYQLLTRDEAFDLTLTAVAILIGYTDAAYETLSGFAA